MRVNKGHKRAYNPTTPVTSVHREVISHGAPNQSHQQLAAGRPAFYGPGQASMGAPAPTAYRSARRPGIEHNGRVAAATHTAPSAAHSKPPPVRCKKGHTGTRAHSPTSGPSWTGSTSESRPRPWPAGARGQRPAADCCSSKAMHRSRVRPPWASTLRPGLSAKQAPHADPSKAWPSSPVTVTPALLKARELRRQQDAAPRCPASC